MLIRVFRLAGASIAAILAAFAVTGCNDDPTGIGSRYLPENVRFATYRATAADWEFLSGVANLANSSSRGSTGVLVGRADDGTIAHGLLIVSDSIKRMEGPGGQTPQSALLRLRSYAYSYGQPTSPQASFDVVAIDAVALDTLKWGPGLVASIEAATVLGTYTGPFDDSSFISVPLDIEATSRFLREYYTYDTTINLTGASPDTVVTMRIRKSLVLRARNDARSVVAFIGSGHPNDSLWPKLEVTFADTTQTLAIGVTSWIADLPLDPGPGRLMVAGGEPIRSHISLRATLPRGATIHQAQIRLHVDTARSRYGSSGPTAYLLLFDAGDDALLPASYLLRQGSSRVYAGFRAARDSASFTDVFVFAAPGPSLTSSLRQGDSTSSFILGFNRGIGTEEDMEAASVNRLVFHGFDASDSTLWPELTVIYSTQTDAP